MPFSIGPLRVDSVAVLAPMAGMTDLSFRALCREQRAGLVYTELVSAEMLLRGVRHSRRLVETRQDERPVGVQLYGHDPAILAEAARWVEANLPCDLIDLNMGCPVPKVVSRGEGASLMKDPKKVERMVRAVADAVRVPVTAKTRSGWDEGDISAPDVARAIEAGGGKAVALHARTRAQRHQGPVDWGLLERIRASIGIPVIGNGGIEDAATALLMRETTGVDAVMVGRGAIGNPWIFGQIDDEWHGRAAREPGIAERLAVIERHLRSALAGFETWAKKDRERQEAERRAVSYCKGHLVRYLRAGPDYAGFLRKLNDLRDINDTLAAARAALAGDRAGRWPGPTRCPDDEAA